MSPCRWDLDEHSRSSAEQAFPFGFSARSRTFRVEDQLYLVEPGDAAKMTRLHWPRAFPSFAFPSQKSLGTAFVIFWAILPEDSAPVCLVTTTWAWAMLDSDSLLTVAGCQ